MTLVKTTETYTHTETGLKGTITSDGRITITPSMGRPNEKGFVFIGSKKETVIKVCEAILELASKAKSAKKKYVKKEKAK